MSMNIRNKTILHFIIFKEDNEKEYTGICYELSLVLTSSDTEKLKEELTSTAQNYVKTILEEKLSGNLLNQQDKLPKKYQYLFKAFDVDHQRSSKDVSKLTEMINSVREPMAFVESSPIAQGA